MHATPLPNAMSTATASFPHSQTFKAPGMLRLALEARAPFEFVASMAAAPWLLNAPRGDGHAVIVYPGFMASDTSTRPLRRLLTALGHDAHGWGQGRNVDARPETFALALQRIAQLQSQSGRKVSLVGWSLGGLYARELAKRAPESVRCVVTLGSPFAGSPKATHAWRLFEFLNGRKPRVSVPQDELRAPPPVPTSSIYSRSDGVVAWQCSVEKQQAQVENIEVHASHMGLGVNPLALHALADRLAQPEGQWKPFERQGYKRFIYRAPA